MVRWVLDPFLPAGWDDARNCLRDAIPGRDELRPQVNRLSFPFFIGDVNKMNANFKFSSLFIDNAPHLPMPSQWKSIRIILKCVLNILLSIIRVLSVDYVYYLVVQ